MVIFGSKVIFRSARNHHAVSKRSPPSITGLQGRTEMVSKRNCRGPQFGSVAFLGALAILLVFILNPSGPMGKKGV